MVILNAIRDEQSLIHSLPTLTATLPTPQSAAATAVRAIANPLYLLTPLYSPSLLDWEKPEKFYAQSEPRK